MDLTNKIGIVTGGVQGIGLAIVESLLQSGCCVNILDINEEAGASIVKKLEANYKNKCFFFKTDVSNRDSIQDAFEKIKEKFGKIHILVNNAAFIDDSPNAWEKSIDVNIKGVVHGCELGIKIMEKGGTIINLSSVAVFMPYLLMPIYCMTKTAVKNLTTIFGSDVYYKQFGIRFMAILPGLTETPAVTSDHCRYFFPEMAHLRPDLAMFGESQTPDYVATCVMKALEFGKNGSLWIARNKKDPELLTISYSTSDANS